MANYDPAYPYGYGGKPADRSNEPGLSWPLDRPLPRFQMMAVGPDGGRVKFIDFDSDRRLTRPFLVILFMDNRISAGEAAEWCAFSQHARRFGELGADLLGVATMAGPALRHVLETPLFRGGLAFPVLADIAGSFSKSFGVLRQEEREWGAARALAILGGPGKKLLSMAVKHETTFSDPKQVERHILHLKACLAEDDEEDSAASSVAEDATAAKVGVREAEEQERRSGGKSSSSSPLGKLTTGMRDLNRRLATTWHKSPSK
jgi:alkyl hydroperoxide reductase subunit AhpC